MASAAMGGVFEALVATAVGLFVAIPAVMAYNFFQRLVRTRIGRTDALAHQLLSLMKADGLQPAPAPSRKAEQSPAVLGAKRDAPPVAPPAAGHLHAVPPPPAPDQSPPVPPPSPDDSLPFSPPRIQQVP
jgi:hypothetical protein